MLPSLVGGRAPKILMLDYFWLQPGYYEERYGMNWLTSKIRELFVSHACQVMLIPVDSRGAVDEMFNGSFDDRPNTVDIEYVSEVDAVKHHPLVRATRHIDLQLKNLSERVCHAKGRWHDMQMQRLKAGPPFVVVFRKGVDWKAYCDDRCVLGDAPEPLPDELRAPPKVANARASSASSELGSRRGTNGSGRRVRCGACEACRAPECGKCTPCRDKPRNGGPGQRPTPLTISERDVRGENE